MERVRVSSPAMGYAPLGTDRAFDAHRSSLELLVEAVRTLASARSLSEVTGIVRQAARRLTGADGATFILREEGRCYYVDEDAIGPLWAGQKFPMEACISGWAMLNARSVVIEDIYADDRIPHDAYRPTFVKSLAMVPIRTADPIGAIGNYWAHHHSATPDEVALLQALADSTAVALENVRIVSDLERLVAERTAKLQRAYDELQLLASGVAHDLRQPLQTVSGYLELLERHLGDRVDTGAPEQLAAVRRGIDTIDHLSSALLAYGRAGSSPLLAVPVDLAALVGDVCDSLRRALDERSAVVDVGPLPVVEGDRTLLYQLFQNLIANALAYVPSDRQPEIRVTSHPRNAGWQITVADNGNGVLPAESETIFEPFQRGTTGHEAPGSGLGLATCKRVAERHGGSIEVCKAPGGGSEFVVVLGPPESYPDR